MAELERVLVAAMERKAPELPRRGHALAGVPEALKALADAPQVIQSALTGNIVRNARAKLSAFGLDRALDLDVGGYGSDNIVRSALVDAARGKVARKYGRHFDRASTVLIGDTPLDVEAARDGGAKIIAVATGAYLAAELESAGADVVLEDLVDLDAFLRALIMLADRYGVDPDELDGPVFPNSFGGLRTSTTRSLGGGTSGDRAGYPWVTFRTFRRSVATILDAAGLSAREIADQLGHSKVSTTQDVYMGRRVASSRAADALDAIRPGRASPA